LAIFRLESSIRPLAQGVLSEKASLPTGHSYDDFLNSEAMSDAKASANSSAWRPQASTLPV
jgi:hypothetical protein